IFVPLRMEVDHEINKSSLEPSPGPTIDDKAGAGELGGAFKIQDAEVFPEVPVGFRLEIEIANRPPSTHLPVLLLGSAHGALLVREIGNHHQKSLKLLLDPLEFLV